MRGAHDHPWRESWRETYFLRRVKLVHDYVLASVTGHRSPINVTATGKAILVFEEPELRDASWPRTYRG